MSRIASWVARNWAGEPSRQFNWVAVAFGIGIGIYFALPVEPPAWVLPLLAGTSAVIALRLTHIPRPLRIALVLVACGAAVAYTATHRLHPVMLGESLTPRPIAGVVDDIVRTEHGVRLTLDHVQIPDADGPIPARVRLGMRLKKDSTLALPHIGDKVAIVAGLLPPMGPALPHSFDFARHFYFKNIGAIGYGLPPWKVSTPAADSGWFTQFRDWRVRVSEQIIAQLGVGSGGVAAGLITGDARAITQADFDALRASNLYHIIAISGEHMVVIAGVIFVSLRLLALVVLPARLRFRPEVKSIAAAASLLLVSAYLFVTGLPISAIRAYGMIALVLLAVMFRRRVDAMRSLSITAFAMLLWDPSNLLDPGFQLSFAATLAILALVEAVLRRGAIALPLGKRILTGLGTMLAVSVVAEAATTPFVIAQFNTVSLYGVFANMLATSLVSFYLMPTVALFFILLPFGLQGFALTLMGYGIQALLTLAHWIAAFPHAQQFAPSLPGWGVALFALGLLWLCIWQTRWRRYGAAAMLLGCASIFTNQLPDMMIGAGQKQIVFREPDGYALARGKATAMIPELWAYGLGEAKLAKAEAPDWRCDAFGCVAKVKGARVAFPRDALALADDCSHAQLILAPFTPATCGNSHARVIDANALGETIRAVWVDGEQLRVEQSSDWQGARPWSRSSAQEDDADDH